MQDAFWRCVQAATFNNYHTVATASASATTAAEQSQSIKHLSVNCTHRCFHVTFTSLSVKVEVDEATRARVSAVLSSSTLVRFSWFLEGVYALGCAYLSVGLPVRTIQ